MGKSLPVYCVLYYIKDSLTRQIHFKRVYWCHVNFLSTLGSNAVGVVFRRMSEDTVECNCGPAPVCIDETTSLDKSVDKEDKVVDEEDKIVDEEDLLKMLEEQNKSVKSLFNIGNTNINVYTLYKT